MERNRRWGSGAVLVGLKRAVHPVRRIPCRKGRQHAGGPRWNHTSAVHSPRANRSSVDLPFPALSMQETPLPDRARSVPARLRKSAVFPEKGISVTPTVLTKRHRPPWLQVQSGSALDVVWTSSTRQRCNMHLIRHEWRHCRRSPRLRPVCRSLMQQRAWLRLQPSIRAIGLRSDAPCSCRHRTGPGHGARFTSAQSGKRQPNGIG